MSTAKSMNSLVLVKQQTFGFFSQSELFSNQVTKNQRIRKISISWVKCFRKLKMVKVVLSFSFFTKKFETKFPKCLSTKLYKSDSQRCRGSEITLFFLALKKLCQTKYMYCANHFYRKITKFLLRQNCIVYHCESTFNSLNEMTFEITSTIFFK